MDILLDPRNKPAKEFFIFLKIQDGRRRSKICDALYFFNVFAITWIRFIGSRQNLAWTHYLTLGTILRKNFSFFSKSKMAAGGQKSKIGQFFYLSQNPRWPLRVKKFPLNICFSFDRRQSSWILRKMKNSSAGLFLGSSTEVVCPC